MYSKFVFAVLLYLGTVQANDIRYGFVTPRSKRIYNEVKEANPAIWTRSEDVVVNAPANEIIDAIYITDLRELKDGKAYLESGGVGTRTATIHLESPNVFRGYKFEIEVFANDPNEAYRIKGGPEQYYGDTQFARKF